MSEGSCPQQRRKLHRNQQSRGNSNKDYINIPLSTKQSRSLAFAVPSLSTRIPGQKRCSFVGTTKFTRCWTTLHRRDWERVRLLPPEPGAQYARKNLVMQNPSVATCSKLEWENILNSFWSFLKGKGAMGCSKKKQDLNKALVQNSLRLLIPEHLKHTRRMQDQPCPTNFSLRWGLIFLGGSRCSELVWFQKSWKRIGIIGCWQASTCLSPGCFAPGERAIGSSALQAW